MNEREQAKALRDAADSVRSHSPGGPIPNLNASQANEVRYWLRARADRLERQADAEAEPGQAMSIPGEIQTLILAAKMAGGSFAAADLGDGPYTPEQHARMVAACEEYVKATERAVSALRRWWAT